MQELESAPVIFPDVIAWNPEVSALRPLGVGISGEVWEGRWKGKRVAVKALTVSTLKHKNLFFSYENKLMQQCQSLYVLSCFHFYNDGNNLSHAVLEYCGYGNLTQWIKQFSLCSTLDQVQLAEQIATGVRYIHAQKIIHRDIKPDNLLFDNFGNIKISDFGFAIEERLVTPGISSMGTPAWMPPESFLPGFISDYSQDVWSMSIIFGQIVSGEEYPFENATTEEDLQRCMDEKQGFPDLSQTDKEFARIINACWEHNKHDRPSAGLVARSLSTLLESLWQDAQNKSDTQSTEINAKAPRSYSPVETFSSE